MTGEFESSDYLFIKTAYIHCNKPRIRHEDINSDTAVEGSMIMNKWKIAFITLSATIIFIFAGGALWLSISSSSENGGGFESPEYDETDGAEFTVNTTKEDINTWISHEMAREGEENFDIFIDDAVYIEAELDAFGFSVPVDMTLIPEMTEDGNLELHEESFQIASLDLPSEQLFQLIAQSMELPEWITVAAEERMLYADIRSSGGAGTDIRLTSFDLEEENIEISITLTGEGESLLQENEESSVE